MATTYENDDGDLAVVQGRNVAVLGYGSQGRAHALSLRDSGVDIRVGLPEASQTRAEAEAEGLRVLGAYDACEEADLIVVLAPDDVQRQLYAEAVEPNLVEGDALLFAHGLAIRFGHVEPPPGVDVCMVAPMGPGALVRQEFSAGRGVPVLVAVDHDASGTAWELTLSYAKAIGGLRAGGIRTTFAEATEAGLFADQAVLSGGSELVVAAFETMTDAGYRPEVAYVACVQELTRMLDLLLETGVVGRRRAEAVPRVIDPALKERMGQVLEDIRSGVFAEPQRNEVDSAQHPIDTTGHELHELMGWLRDPQPNTRQNG